MAYNKPRTGEKKKRWSLKYKKSINCSDPKGFSQINYCNRKKRGGGYKSESFMNLFLDSVVDEQVEEGIGKNIVMGALATALAGSPAKMGNTKPNIEKTSKSTSLNLRSTFDEIVNTIIDNIEGGYYKPGQVNNKLYSKSGETMFGMDRKTGKDLFKSEKGKEFWDTIDQARKKNKKDWVWMYKGGDKEGELKSLVKDIMFPEFEKYKDRYLKPEARKIVEGDYNLLFNFVYSTWNGPRWFRDFADKINDAVESGEKDPKELFKIAIKAREDSGNTLIKKTADKILKSVKK